MTPGHHYLLKYFKPLCGKSGFFLFLKDFAGLLLTLRFYLSHGTVLDYVHVIKPPRDLELYSNTQFPEDAWTSV